jgi:hypothetical protein
MSKIELKNIYGDVIFSDGESKTLREAMEKKKADLSEADLSEANLSEADLSEADLSEANLSEADLWKADLSEAKGIVHIQFEGKDLWIQDKISKIGCSSKKNSDWLKMPHEDIAKEFGELEAGRVEMYKTLLRAGIRALKMCENK